MHLEPKFEGYVLEENGLLRFKEGCISWRKDIFKELSLRNPIKDFIVHILV
jgi:hypothetical protein